MTARDACRFAAPTALVFAFSSFAHPNAAAANQPNIVLFLADDKCANVLAIN